MGVYFQHCHQVENMLRSALVLLCIALAVQAKTRRGPLPHLFWDKVKHLDVVDEPEDKIVGGEEVDISERPFQIVFLYYGSLRCGGAWMGGKNILTAAHCCDGVSASSVSVRMGSSRHASGGDVYDVARVISHPNYDDFDISNDACILVLEEEPTNSVAQPVDLPSGPILAHTEKMSCVCSPLYCTMPARLSIRSSMKDLTSMSLAPSRGVHVVNREDSSPHWPHRQPWSQRWRSPQQGQ